jgi:hypothetical protein
MDSKIQDEHREILAHQLENQSLRSSNDAEVKWQAIKHSIHTVAEEVLGTTQPKKLNGRFDQDCQTALEIRNEARK